MLILGIFHTLFTALQNVICTLVDPFLRFRYLLYGWSCKNKRALPKRLGKALC